MRPARFLVLRGGALGDFIVTIPTLAALRRRWPDAHIELIGYPHLARIAQHSGLINATRSLFDSGLARYFAWNAPIRESDQSYFASFDVIINFLHDPDGVLSDNLKRCGVEVLLQRSPLVTARHAVEHFLSTLESLAIYDAATTPELTFTLSPNDREMLPENAWLAIHPGSGGREKNWPIEHFITMARQWQSASRGQVVFITGDAELEYIPELETRIKPFPRWHNLDLITLGGLLRHAAVYLGNDSGISHLAAAAGCSTVALFGPSNPDLWAPRGRQVNTIISPTRHMRDIAFQDVWETLIQPPP